MTDREQRRPMTFLARYPKTRPPLPKAYADIHAVAYKINREGRTRATSLALRLEAWLHRQVARDVVGSAAHRSTLEIGAGTLNQLPYEPIVGPYDIVEPNPQFYDGSPLLARVRNVYTDPREIPPDQRYERITSIATFEHLCDLPFVVARAALLLTPDGQLRVAIPSEGTPLWTLGWKLTTGLEFRLRHGLAWGLLLRHEHVNAVEPRYTLIDIAGENGLGWRAARHERLLE